MKVNTPLKKKMKICLRATTSNQGTVSVWIIHNSFVEFWVWVFFFASPFLCAQGRRKSPFLQTDLKHSSLTSNPITKPDISRQAAIFSSSLRVQQVTQQWLLGTGTNIARETGWSGLHLSRTLQAQVNSSA